MRILHVLHNSLPNLSGYSIRSSYIVDRQRAMGMEPCVVTSAQHPNGDAAEETIAGTRYRRTPTPRRLSRLPFVRERSLMAALEREIEGAAREIKPDVIHAHSPVLVGLPALRVARRLGIPLVYEVRDLWENASVDRGKFTERSLLYRMARAVDGYVLARADAVVTICEGLKGELVTRVGSAAKVRVVANGVDTTRFRPEPASLDIVERRGLAGKEIVLYAGTFQPYEGLDLLIRAMTRIISARPAAHLVIVGGSSGLAGSAGSPSAEETLLQRLVRELDLEDRVTFTGRIPHGEVNGMYALADVVAYPRRWTRTTSLTTPLKPLEAMAMAKAVVVSDLPPMRELVADRSTGLVFKADDADDLARTCCDLLADAELRERLGRAARQWVTAEREWSTVVEQYAPVYEAVCNRVLPTALPQLAAH